MPRRIAILGAGISGLTAAWALTRPGSPFAVTLFEAQHRTGGIIQTARPRIGNDEYILELGPDSWVTEKPAARHLVEDLGLAHELIASIDSTRKTWLLRNGTLQPIPDNLRMMVPVGTAGLASIAASTLFSPAARLAVHAEVTRAAELQAAVPLDDESIASFVERHFGPEVLHTLAAPLLSGVFGGDVHTLSVRAVMAPFVAMERQHGSLIAALEEREAERLAAGRPTQPLFATLRSGLGTLTDTLAAQLPPGTLRLGTPVHALHRVEHAQLPSWQLRFAGADLSPGSSPAGPFDHVILALPADATSLTLQSAGAAGRHVATLLPAQASSAILVAFAWPPSPDQPLLLPQGFGFLVPPPAPCEPPQSALLACTFVDQKFPHRAPSRGRILRAFFGGETAAHHLARNTPDNTLAGLALAELRRHLGPLPDPAATAVSRWPRSLPQYAVGHLNRIAQLDRALAALPGLHLLGNSLHGVGLSDLIRQARSLAGDLLTQPAPPA